MNSVSETHIRGRTGWYWLLGVLTVTASGAASSDEKWMFREDWSAIAEISEGTAMIKADASAKGIRVDTHGPGRGALQMVEGDGISTHPSFVWSGNCAMSWAVSLQKITALIDLSSDQASVRWRSRQTGDRQLHLLIKLPGERWFVSEQSDGGAESWHDYEFRISTLSWRRFGIIKAEAGEPVAAPEMNKVEAIGFTDGMPGGGEQSSSRVASIEVYGKPVALPPINRRPAWWSRMSTDLPSSVEAASKVVYASYGSRQLTLDLYRPKYGTGPYPVVVFIHGGGWFQGDPSVLTAMAQRLATKEYVTVNISYRLSGEAEFPAALADCEAAVRWCRMNADSYSIDRRRIGVVGGSAGGHLAGLLATAGNEKLRGTGESNDIQACVVMAGEMDLEDQEFLRASREDPRQRAAIFLGGTWEQAKDRYVLASPAAHVSDRTAAMLFLDGEQDHPAGRYTKMTQRLDACGIYHEFHLIAGAPHAFWSVDPFFVEAMGFIVPFFDQTLKHASNHAPRSQPQEGGVSTTKLH